MSTNGESPAPEGAGDSRDPSGFLSEIIGAPVTVKLNSGIVYKGMFDVTVETSEPFSDAIR
jgi:U6 snRNA-associated Sm-like protein LSm6